MVKPKYRGWQRSIACTTVRWRSGFHKKAADEYAVNSRALEHSSKHWVPPVESSRVTVSTQL
eukprot:4449561-Amphidinium_carterae.2